MASLNIVTFKHHVNQLLLCVLFYYCVMDEQNVAERFKKINTKKSKFKYIIQDHAM